ncbi:MAG: hypothetical protein V4481_04775 [Patescibacteria group bacterium]
MASFGKYFGSKQRFARELVEFILEYTKDMQYDAIIEPFCGTACTLQKFREKVDCPIFGSDKLAPLIVTLKAFQWGNFACPSSITQADFDRLKNDETDPLHIIVHAGASYFGQYKRDRFYGYTNVNLAKIAKRLAKKPPQLNNIDFKCCEYTDWSETKNCLFILDPPYSGAKASWSVNFRGFDNALFWKWAEMMSRENIVLVCEYEAPENWTCIWSKSFRTANRHGGIRTKTEKVFVLIKP